MYKSKMNLKGKKRIFLVPLFFFFTGCNCDGGCITNSDWGSVKEAVRLFTEKYGINIKEVEIVDYSENNNQKRLQFLQRIFDQ